MIIRSLFENDINRSIETVIKADDRDHISNEVVEYVITKEIATKIQGLFSAYINYAGANGVWISGFFGSGKSHLLKILSYVLENRAHDGYRCGELFAEKIENDAMLKGDVLAATRIPSESILFNIDQQAQITSKEDANAILSVFYKVFFDHLGYYGFQTHVAEFEMWLDKQGLYRKFQDRFEQLHGSPWEKARVDYFDPIVTENSAKVLGELFGQPAEKYYSILDDIENKQKHSIDDLCIRINEYIESRQAGFRLNFFVDEIGQYISGNSKLMLNIQTLAETMATRTKGRAWIFVTSQEDMEKVVGDMSKSQQNDFSRIQARFLHKIPLTSANVDEVIEKRLLKKNEDAKALLTTVWKNENANLNTLLSFSDIGVQFRKYNGADDFINKYPFASYQFSLFQECRRALSTHNAFQGRHQSVGERSMLGVFQQVVRSIEHLDENTIVSFDKMYEGIRNELRGEIQSSITLAERNIDDPFAVQVLKTLFMVKYFVNFKPTRRNISVLMLDNMHPDLKAHEKRIDVALNMLENQNYVQRNGELYEFLTDDEKDIETSIKATEIEDSALMTMLREVFFDEIIRENKIRFQDNKHEYDFASKIDGTLVTREKELVIEIITPDYPDYANTAVIQAHTMGSATMKVLLPPDPLLMKDLKLYLKTMKYIKVSQSTTSKPEVKRIFQEKLQQSAERKRSLVALANKLLIESDVYMNGARHEAKRSSDGKTFIILNFQDLIRIVYSSLRMLGTTQFTEDTVRDTLSKKQSTMFSVDEMPLTEAEGEILNFVKRQKAISERTSLNDIKEHFSRKPFGWYPNAIWTIVAKLYKRDNINLSQDSNTLDDEDVLSALLNSKFHINTLVEPKAGERPEDVRKLKKLYADLFDETVTASSGKEIGNAFRDRLRQTSVDVEKLMMQQKEYRFIGLLAPLSEQLERLSRRDYTYLLTNQENYADSLLDAKESLLDPIKRFYNGDQRKIYDSISQILNGDTSNLEYIDGDELSALKQAYHAEKPFTGTLIRDAKAAITVLRDKLGKKLEQERQLAVETIEKLITELEGMNDFGKLSHANQADLIIPFKEALDRLRVQKHIAVMRDIKHRATDELMPRQLNKMLQLTAPVVHEGEPKMDTPHYINQSSIKVKFSKNELCTEEDVEHYTNALSEALKEQIKKNKRIKL